MELRESVRHAVNWPVEFEQGSGVTRNMSAGGACIETPLAFDKGDAIHFTVRMPDRPGQPARLLCEGRVVWVAVEDGDRELGVSLDKLEFGL